MNGNRNQIDTTTCQLEYSTWGIAFNLLGQSLFIGLYIWALLSGDPAFRWWIKILTGMLILVFVHGSVQNVCQLVSGKPAAVMDAEGLHVNLAGFGSYRLAWEQIADVRKKKKLFQAYVGIQPVNRFEFRSYPWYMRLYFWINWWYYDFNYIITMDVISVRSAATADDVIRMIDLCAPASAGLLRDTSE
ncbi:MAG: hypothetical protein R3330_05755 [Saprospiraceae bacterium]|nr:hypothetical protein [Saprospiraceae bacterium]